MNGSPRSPGRSPDSPRRATTFSLFSTTAAAEHTLSLWLNQALDPRRVSIVVQKRTMLLHMARYDKLDQVQHSGIIQRAPLDRLAGMLVGVGATAVPGLGAVLAVGPLATIVRHAPAGLVAAFEQANLPPQSARRIHDSLRKGHVLLALHGAPASLKQRSAPSARTWTTQVNI